MKPKKNIIFSSYDSIDNPYYGGGGAIVIHEITKRLQHRYNIMVVTSAFPGAKDAVIDGVSYHRLGLPLHSPYLTQIIFQFLLPLKMWSRRSSFDLWVESYTSPFSTAALSLFTRKPVVGIVQLLAGQKMKEKYFRLPFPILEKMKLKFYQYLIVLSHTMKKEIHHLNVQANIAVIPNGVDPTLASVPRSKKPQHILFIGRIDVWQKGLDLLLHAYSQIPPLKRIPLHIYGSGNEQDTLQLSQHISSMGLEQHVALMGKVTGEAKAKVFANAQFLVLPSRYEAQPLVVLEAFSVGVPVVCFDIEGLAWLDHKHSLKIPSFDTKAYAQALYALIADSNLRKRLGDQVKVYAQQFDWNLSARQYQRMFDQIL
jgi:phosphatidylinositol alpha-mannosyltransferase